MPKCSAAPNVEVLHKATSHLTRESEETRQCNKNQGRHDRNAYDRPNTRRDCFLNVLSCRISAQSCRREAAVCGTDSSCSWPTRETIKKDEKWVRFTKTENSSVYRIYLCCQTRTWNPLKIYITWFPKYTLLLTYRLLTDHLNKGTRSCSILCISINSLRCIIAMNDLHTSKSDNRTKVNSSRNRSKWWDCVVSCRVESSRERQLIGTLIAVVPN